MRIGDTTGEIDQRILDLGFPFTNELTILGFNIRNDDSYIAKNFESILTKITGITKFWERFNLTLPGKIMVYKTLLISQLNFAACILSPPLDLLSKIEDVIERFVLKGLNIGKNKIYLPTSMGGLGLFDLRKFINSLQVTWVLRAKKNCNDNWKVALKTIGDGEVLNCNKVADPSSYGAALQNIIVSYSLFCDAFFKYGNNFLKDKIFDNKRYGTGRARVSTFNHEFFGQQTVNLHHNRLINLKWENLLLGNQFVPFNEFEFVSGFPIRRELYNKLKYAFCSMYKTEFSEPALTLQEFFRRIKKGSRNFRRIFENVPAIKKNYFAKNVQVKSHCKSAEINFSCESRWSSLLGSWDKQFLPNRFRVFLFKYYHNKLGTGSRIAHFLMDSDPSCIFCTRAKLLPAPIESFSHVFYDCPIIFNIISRFCSEYFTVPVTREMFFGGNFSELEKNNKLCTILCDTLRYSIWQIRLQKNQISYYTAEYEMISLLEQIMYNKKPLKYALTNCTFIRLNGVGLQDGHPDDQRP
jgi:hypothetical protein